MVENKTEVIVCKTADEFDECTVKHKLGHPYAGGRARGRIKSNETALIVVDRSYYRNYGIRDEQLQAVITHEITELQYSGDGNAHLAGTLAEYQVIYDAEGAHGLRQYHGRLCTAIGGRNDVRNEALKAIITK